MNYMKRQYLPADIPDAPGVYFFQGGKDILYIGKATSLKDRVRSYFARDILETRGLKIEKMLELATNVDWQETDSVLEALILESNLIKKHQPEYNTKEKDNKSYNYIVITDEKLPRVFTVRERELLKKQKLDFKVKYSFGPYPNGNLLKEALNVIRKIFPFRDKKSKQKSQARFYEMLGLSPEVAKKKATVNYQESIKNLKLFLEGKKSQVVKNLEKNMMVAAKALLFEEALALKKQLFAINHIQDISLLKTENQKSLLGDSFRIEAYDVAHMSGKNAVGVMTVVVNGEVQKGEYRKFKINSDKEGSDTHALCELLERRLAHPEWEWPKLIVVDGGTAQKRVAEKVLRETGNEIPVVSVVKDKKHRPREVRGQKKFTLKYEQEILLANYEAHRFAISYHKQLRREVSLQ